MRRFALASLGLVLLLLAIFAVAQWLQIPLLTDPTPWLSRGRPLAASISFGLLLADVLIPVPSSLLMIANGTLFGLWGGAALSLAGGLGAALAGWAIGRRGGALLARTLTPGERDTARRLVERWGVLAIIITRPVPVLAETVAIMAGAVGMSMPRVALGAAAGLLPLVIFYAWIGAL
ncbi:MAG TPA: VTT domain-containing protein [Symbiobacteriaceae bacterium]|nr:VTT domain-containing protein [Symbiobacteriaceae bacterium]